MNCRLNVNEIKQLCNFVEATDHELAEALPYDEEESVGSIGGSLVNKILSREVGIKWDLYYATKECLILIGCQV